MAWYWYLVMGLLGVGFGWWVGGLVARRFARRHASSRERCRSVEVDGGIISVRGGEPMTGEDLVMFAQVIRAAKAKFAAERIAASSERPAAGYRADDASRECGAGRAVFDPEAWLRQFGPMTNEGRDFLAKVAKARIDRDG